MKRPVFLTFGIISIDLTIALLMLFGIFHNADNLYDFLTRFLPYLLGGVFGLYISGYWGGLEMEILIRKKKYSPTFTGITGLFIILIIGIFCGSLVGLLIAGISEITHENILDVLRDYFLTPQLLILIFGGLPTLLTGAFLGYLLKLD